MRITTEEGDVVAYRLMSDFQPIQANVARAITRQRQAIPGMRDAALPCLRMRLSRCGCITRRHRRRQSHSTNKRASYNHATPAGITGRLHGSTSSVSAETRAERDGDMVMPTDFNFGHACDHVVDAEDRSSANWSIRRNTAMARSSAIVLGACYRPVLIASFRRKRR